MCQVRAQDQNRAQRYVGHRIARVYEAQGCPGRLFQRLRAGAACQVEDSQSRLAKERAQGDFRLVEYRQICPARQ